jgi:excisionase family DNA binding protein
MGSPVLDFRGSKDMAAEKAGLLTTGQAAKLCAVTPDTVLKWIKKGRLAATRTAGGHYRVSLPDLEPFLAGFGQKAPELAETRAFPAIASQDGTNGAAEEVPCWEFLSENGDLREACRQCVVYRVRATRCFLMAGLDTDVGHAHQFCEGSCEDCVYYRRIQGMSTQVLFISSDEELVGRIGHFEEGTIALRFARNGYEASALIQDFRPEIAIIDLEGLPDQGFGLLDSIAADPRIPHIRVILVIPSESMGRMLQRPRHRLVVSMLEKPQVCDRIEEVVKGSLVEMAPVAESQSA